MTSPEAPPNYGSIQAARMPNEGVVRWDTDWQISVLLNSAHIFYKNVGLILLYILR